MCDLLTNKSMKARELIENINEKQRTEHTMYKIRDK